MSNHKINGKKSSHFNEKVWLRMEALQNVKCANVLDCFHGSGKIWEYLLGSEKNIKSIVGIEKNKRLRSSFKVINGDNIEILRTISLADYNIFDLDAYGYPIKQMDILFKRLQKESIIIYTMCYTHLARIPKQFYIGNMITEVCPTILGRYTHEMFSNYLLMHGVEEYYEYSFKDGLMEKYYGYFIYSPKKT